MTPKQTLNLFALLFLLAVAVGCASAAAKAPAPAWGAEQSIPIVATGATRYLNTN